MRRALLLAVTCSAIALALSCAQRASPREPETDPLGPNAGCYICHQNFLREPISSIHLKAKIACVRCHGASIGHANDEDIGATPPDVRFKRTQVNALCRTCHKTHDVAPEKLVVLWRKRCRLKLVATRPAGPVTCTDCHGRHRIARAKQRPPAR